MAMIKVWYPGPGVVESEATREQAHLTLGVLRPGWNEVDEDSAMAPLAAGLVTLDEPASFKAHGAEFIPAATAATKPKDDIAPLALDKE